MQGRKPYPQVLMEANNERDRLTREELKKRRLNEPKTKSNRLRCPKHLESEAKKEWRRIVKLYGEFKQAILSDLDCNALEVYCNALVTYRKATKMVRETSEIYVRKGDKTPKKNPWLRIAEDASETMRKYGEILLLNPVSRARMGIAKAKPVSEMTRRELFNLRIQQQREQEKERCNND